MSSKFEDLRPYHQSEIPAAMQRIAESEHFEMLSRYIFPNKDVEEVRTMVKSIQSTEEFQRQIMSSVNEQIVSRSINTLTSSGFEQLDPAKNYLFVSNHRDIMLDSSLFQFLLHKNGLRTTEITFGSNLMHPQLVVDIGKANKMFKVERSSNMREFLYNSNHLSEYIRHTITEKGESIWIAQRNGRTKDGNDATDQGIIKMFCLSGGDNLAQALAGLNIVPIAISYQIESCDMFKTRELYQSMNGAKYVKRQGEDLNSILTGILQPKGHVNISICKPIMQEELEFACKNKNGFFKAVASLIDKRIYGKYKLYDNNYIAHDMRSGKETYKAHYTNEAKETFAERQRHLLEQIDGDKQILSNIFLGIYANPVDKINLNSSTKK